MLLLRLRGYMVRTNYIAAKAASLSLCYATDLSRCYVGHKGRFFTLLLPPLPSCSRPSVLRKVCCGLLFPGRVGGSIKFLLLFCYSQSRGYSTRCQEGLCNFMTSPGYNYTALSVYAADARDWLDRCHASQNSVFCPWPSPLAPYRFNKILLLHRLRSSYRYIPALVNSDKVPIPVY
jgi:hypothetical protein